MTFLLFCVRLFRMSRSNLEAVRARIHQVCARVGRDPNEITLVCVTKGVDINRIREVVGLGITDIGENRVQEAREKFGLLTSLQATGNRRQAEIRWHMVGHLQRNKAKHAVRIFDLIHSVDSLDLAQEIDKEAKKIEKIQEILIEVNVSGESTKFGITAEETFLLAKEVSKLTSLRLKGLMTIAPLVDNPEKVRPYFKALRELRDEINQLLTVNCKLLTLSMGMSQDFEVAIEEGATMMRIGTAIFRSETRNQSTETR